MSITTKTVTEIKCDLCGALDTEPWTFAQPTPFRTFYVGDEQKPVVVCPACMAKPVNDILAFAGEGF